MLARLLKSQIRVLLVEDNPTDALVVQDELAHVAGMVFVIEHLTRLAAAVVGLAQRSFDIVLLDLSLPDSDGLAGYTRLQAAWPDGPIVVLTHASDEDSALQAVGAGAQDYLVKGQTTGQLPRAIRYAIERAHARKALRASEARWSAALEGVGDGVWDWDVAAQTVFYSPRWKAMLGYADGDVGTSADEWTLRMHSEDLPHATVALQSHLDGLSPAFVHEHRLRCKDGSYLWVLGRATVTQRDAAGKPLRMVGTNVEISARRQADEQLRLLQLSVAHINEVVIIASHDANDKPNPRIMFVNPAFERCTGYTAADAMGRTPAMLDGPTTQRDTLDRIATAMAQGQAVQAEIINHTKAGEPFWLELEITPLMGRDGQPAHWVAVGRNMDERKRAAQQMEAALQELRASQEQLQTLSRRVMRVQEAERRRVALELHDELGQTLTAIKINLMGPASADWHAPTELQTENVRIVETALQQVRRLALALRPSMLDDLGLEAALSWLATTGAGNASPHIALQCSMARERLDSDMETACFRIVQESLTNIRRHAKAHAVHITLVVGDENLELTVQDDGRGFDTARAPGRDGQDFSLGLLGMRERALGVGARLSIVSSPGNGCTVRLVCAL